MATASITSANEKLSVESFSNCLDGYQCTIDATAEEIEAITRDGLSHNSISYITPTYIYTSGDHASLFPYISTQESILCAAAAVSTPIIQQSSQNTIKFDSACSSNLSGDPQRLKNSHPVDSLRIKGFNNSTSSVALVGFNSDGKKEYYVPNMPPNLVLLCAQQYSSDGASILLPNEGFVLSLTAEDQRYLKNFAETHHISKHLIVKNNTYEVSQTSLLSPEEEAYSSTATKFFNSKVNVSNAQERILATLLTGLTFNDILSFTKNNSVLGLPRDITQSALNSFEHSYGRTPDVLQLAFPDLSGNKKGYMAPKEVLTTVGERVEADFFDIEFNELPDVTEETTPATTRRKKHPKKLASHGGAIAAYVYIDVYTGYIGGTLVTSLANPLPLVQSTVHEFGKFHHQIKLFSADQGIIHQSQFRVATPAVQQFLEDSHIGIELGEAYNHNVGTPHIEKTLRQIQELIRFAMLYVLRNPNFRHFGFSKVQVLKLWGEIFYWAIAVINLKPSFPDPAITKYEYFTKRKPDLRAIRLLPIFSSLYVLRNSAHAELQSNHTFWQFGLYVGPSLTVPGAIRAAVLTNNKVIIITTTSVKSISDGGHISLYPSSTNGLNCLIDENDDEDVVTTDLTLPEHTLLTASDSITSPPDNDPTTTNNIDTVEQLSTQDLLPPSTTEPQLSSSLSESASTHQSTFVPSLAIPSLTELPNIVPQDVRQQRPKNTRLTPEEQFTAMKQTWGTRSERLLRRQQQPISNSAELLECCFVDWSQHNSDSEKFYYSFTDNAYVTVCNDDNAYSIPPDPASFHTEDCFRAIRENVPRTFSQALSDPEWGDAARIEFQTIFVDTRAAVEIPADLARFHIDNGAEVLRFMPVYEEKVKEGRTVRKVRLVINGSKHHKHGATYSATPSRETFLLILHIIAVFGWDTFHIDEQRAFLNAIKRDKIVTLAKIPGDPRFYEIVKAFYGLKTASRDYQETVIERYIQMGFHQLDYCASTYYKYENGNICIVYAYVDDFVCTGNNNNFVMQCIHQYRQFAATTSPAINPSILLGLEITRNKERNTISITMKRRIEDLAALFPDAIKKSPKVPMPTSGYIVDEDDLDALPASHSRLLNADEHSIYMQIVGCLIWIQSIRMDIIFTVLYLSWYTHRPRFHHLSMAFHCIAYLHHTIDIPLVLGGAEPVLLHGYSDASLATGPKRRSIAATITKLNPSAGAISATATTTKSVCLSSFEAELDGLTSIFKKVYSFRNILKDLFPQFADKGIINCDNQALVNFINGDGGIVKGVRHINIRQEFTKEKVKEGHFSLQHVPGATIPTDKLTKLGNPTEHAIFLSQIQGLHLLKK